MPHLFRPFRPWAAALLLAPLFAVLAYLQFSPWQSAWLWGDDLHNLFHFSTGSWREVVHSAFFETYFARYRPVFSLAWGAWRGAFGLAMDKYHAALFCVHVANAVLVFLLANVISRHRLLASAALACAFTLSRFAFYQVTVLTGLIEAMSLFFFLLMLLCVSRMYFEETRTNAMRLGAIVAFALTIATHERYMAAIPWLSVFLFIGGRAPEARSKRLLWAGIPWAMLIANYALKTLFLNTNFMEGTGGHGFDLNIPRTAMHMAEAALSLLGANTGPEYLVSLRTGGWMLLPAALIAASFVYVCAGVLRSGQKSDIVFSTGLLTLAALMLGPPLLTIRLEQRWLLAPEVMMLMLFACALRQNRVRHALAVTLVYCVALIGLDTYITQSARLNFMGYGAAMGDLVAKSVADGSAGAPGTPLIIQTSTEGCENIGNGESFERLEGVPRKVICINDPDQARAMARQLGQPLFMAVVPRSEFRRTPP